MKNQSERMDQQAIAEPAMTEQERAGPPKRVLILSADAGFGHKAAANAIAAAFRENHAGATSVEIVNPLDHANAPGLLVTAQDDYDRMIQQSPDLYRAGYEASAVRSPGLAEQALTLMLYGALRDSSAPNPTSSSPRTHVRRSAHRQRVIASGHPFLTVVTDRNRSGCGFMGGVPGARSVRRRPSGGLRPSA
jgi:1,2-diacylglycerol 3-beta-galactosyltransferase